MLKTLMIVLSMAVYGHLGGNHVYEYMEQRWKCPGEARVQSFLQTLSDEGTWSDVDYADRSRSGWKSLNHAKHMRDLAAFYHYNPSREDVREAFLRALRWWCRSYPQCPNWWYNEVAVPFEFGICGLWMRDAIPQEDMDNLIRVVDQVKKWRTGQNKVWAARNRFLKGLLTDDEQLVRACRDSLVSEIAIRTKEGIQPDWSYHQHGPQLQFGNYGLSYAKDMSEWVRVLEGTGLDIDGEHLEILRNYIGEGLRWVLWRDCFDFSACGRQVSPGSQKSKAQSAREAMQKLGIGEAPAGAKYYPYSDFGIYRTGDWYASIRMQSNRTVGYEHTNTENMLAYFSADGALLVRRTGDEYNDNCAAWNWRHIPGVTSWDDGAKLWGTPGEKPPYNHSDKVFGKVQGDIMVAAMEYRRAGLSAHKAWIFFPKGILCIGAGITQDRKLKREVQTAVNQCWLRGPVERGKNWVRHDGISYVFLDKNKYVLAPEQHSGTWEAIHKNKGGDISCRLFDLYTSHGNSPKKASYAYLVIPSEADGAEAAAFAASDITISSNTDARQSTVVAGAKISIDWEKAEILIEE